VGPTKNLGIKVISLKVPRKVVPKLGKIAVALQTLLEKGFPRPIKNWKWVSQLPSR